MVEEVIPYHRPMIEYKGSYMISNGTHVRALEQSIKEMYDVEHVIACSSCSMGLLIVLDRYSSVISTPSFAWYSSKWAIDLTENLLKFEDINSKTWLMKDCENIFKLPIHTFGNIGKYSGHCIYDGAHALGAEIKDFGLATVFSLAPTKLVTACEGGLILTNNDDLARDCIYLRDKVSRMSEPNADWGLYTLNMLDDILEWKQLCYEYYKKNLPGIFQEIPYSSNYNTIGMLTDLKIPAHIECKKYYEPLSLEPHLKITKYVFNKIVCLPSWFGVDYEKIVNDILEYNENLDNGRIRLSGTGHLPIPKPT